MPTNKKIKKKSNQNVSQAELFEVISSINLAGTDIGKQVLLGNVYAERLIAQYVLYQQYARQEKFKRLLVDAYRKYIKMLAVK